MRHSFLEQAFISAFLPTLMNIYTWPRKFHYRQYLLDNVDTQTGVRLFYTSGKNEIQVGQKKKENIFWAFQLLHFGLHIWRVHVPVRLRPPTFISFLFCLLLFFGFSCCLCRDFFFGLLYCRLFITQFPLREHSSLRVNAYMQVYILDVNSSSKVE